MSRGSRFDTHAGRDLQPRRELADRQRTPDEVCRDILAELERLPRTSEREQLIRDARALRRALELAQAAGTADRRRAADAAFEAKP